MWYMGYCMAYGFESVRGAIDFPTCLHFLHIKLNKLIDLYAKARLSNKQLDRQTVQMLMTVYELQYCLLPLVSSCSLISKCLRVWQFRSTFFYDIRNKCLYY